MEKTKLGVKMKLYLECLFIQSSTEYLFLIVSIEMKLEEIWNQICNMLTSMESFLLNIEKERQNNFSPQLFLFLKVEAFHLKTMFFIFGHSFSTFSSSISNFRTKAAYLGVRFEVILILVD